MTEVSIESTGVRERLDRALAEQLKALRGSDLREITVEAVAQDAGVSRATAYRYLGNREELLYRSALMLVREHTDRCAEVVAREPTVAGKVEASFAYGVQSLVSDELMRLPLRSPRAEPIDNALRAMGDEIMLEPFRRGQADGQVRTDMSAEELLDWQFEQYHVVLRLELDQDAVRLWVRRFILPVLRPPVDADAGLRSQVRAALDHVQQCVQDLDRGIAAAREAVEGD